MLAEADNENHPLLERLRFLSISETNLDEFYMVRVAGLNGQVLAGVLAPSQDGLTPVQQLLEINRRASNLMQAQQVTWRELRACLNEAGIAVIGPHRPHRRGARLARRAVPLRRFSGADAARHRSGSPVSVYRQSGSWHGAAIARRGGREREDMRALILVPAAINRFVRLPGKGLRFLPVEQMIGLFLDRLFPGFSVVGKGMFRILRDSEVELEEEAEDLVRVYETALKRRRLGNVIRLSVEASMPDDQRQFLIEQLDVSTDDVFALDGLLGLGDVKQLIVDERPDLLFTPYNARFPERIRDFGGDCFAAIRQKDIVVHHPYESFDVVVQFVRQAARDPAVVAIKQTLYRTSDDSPIVQALIEAAEAGKSVTALVELKARFDEEANIRWARDLERAGVQVVYGFLELKTHAKVSLVVRREAGQLRSYVHFGTGNYHPYTAKVYTDLSFFTSDEALCRDAARLFNYMTGYATPAVLEKIAVAPISLRARLNEMIEMEIANAVAGKPAQIWAKLNRWSIPRSSTCSTKPRKPGSRSIWSSAASAACVRASRGCRSASASRASSAASSSMAASSASATGTHCPRPRPRCSSRRRIGCRAISTGGSSRWFRLKTRPSTGKFSMKSWWRTFETKRKAGC